MLPYVSNRVRRFLEHDVGALYRLDRLFGNSGDDSFLEGARARLAILEFNGNARRFYDRQCGVNNLRPDTIAGEYGYLSF